jgi:predicted O-methyltransferase YrrM
MIYQIITKIKARISRFEERFHPFEIVHSDEVVVLEEFDIRPDLRGEIGEHLKVISDYIAKDCTADLTLAHLLYQTIIDRKPLVVVETGVWHGVSSYVILSALSRNGGGHLHSVDLPPLRISNRVVVGAAVPEELRKCWTLNLSSSVDYLQKSMPECDIFIHDSEHTYRNMLTEFRLAWPKIREGGLLISDDAHSNAAILDFAKEVGSRLTLIRREKGGFCGFIVKE